MHPPLHPPVSPHRTNFVFYEFSKLFFLECCESAAAASVSGKHKISTWFQHWWILVKIVSIHALVSCWTHIKNSSLLYLSFLRNPVSKLTGQVCNSAVAQRSRARFGLFRLLWRPHNRLFENFKCNVTEMFRNCFKTILLIQEMRFKKIRSKKHFFRDEKKWPKQNLD